MKTILCLIVMLALGFERSAVAQTPLSIPSGIILMGTNAVSLPAVTFTNLSTNAVTARAFDVGTLDVFRLVSVPTGSANGPLTPAKYQSTVPAFATVRLGPWGSSNCVGQLPARRLRNGLVVQSSGELDTDYIAPTNAPVMNVGL